MGQTHDPMSRGFLDETQVGADGCQIPPERLGMLHPPFAHFFDDWVSHSPVPSRMTDWKITPISAVWSAVSEFVCRRRFSVLGLLAASGATTFPALFNFRDDAVQCHPGKQLLALGRVVAVTCGVLIDKPQGIDDSDLSIQYFHRLGGDLGQRPCVSYHCSSSSINSMGETDHIRRPVIAFAF
jgi:hypothetical protein